MYDGGIVVKYAKHQIGIYETILDPYILEIAFLKSAFNVNVCLSPSVYNVIGSGPSPAAMIHDNYSRGKDLVEYLMDMCKCPRVSVRSPENVTGCTMSFLNSDDIFDHISSFLRLSVFYYIWADDHVSSTFTRSVYSSSMPFPFSYIFYYMERNSKIKECKSNGLSHESYVTRELELIYKTIKPLLINGTFGSGNFTNLDMIVFSSMAILLSLPIKSTLFTNFVNNNKYLVTFVMDVNNRLRIWPCKNTFLSHIDIDVLNYN